MKEIKNKNFVSWRNKIFDKGKNQRDMNMHRMCNHAFWIEDLNKEGYFCACQTFKMRPEREHFD